MRRRESRRLRARRGVSLVELLVALSLLTIGLLAIVGTSGAVARSLGEARGDTMAALMAQSRFELLAGTQCTSLTLNTDIVVTTRGITESYRITDGGNYTRQVVNNISWTTREGTRRQVFTTILPCRTGA